MSGTFFPLLVCRVTLLVCLCIPLQSLNNTGVNGLMSATAFPPHHQPFRSYLEQADFPSVRYHPPAWDHCPQAPRVWMDPSYWLHILAGWHACWSRLDLCSGKRGWKRAWWSVWTAQHQPGGTGCWCCCCSDLRPQIHNGSGRTQLDPPTQRKDSTVSMFSLSLSEPVGVWGKKSVNTQSWVVFCKDQSAEEIFWGAEYFSNQWFLVPVSFCLKYQSSQTACTSPLQILLLLTSLCGNYIFYHSFLQVVLQRHAL